MEFHGINYGAAGATKRKVSIDRITTNEPLKPQAKPFKQPKYCTSKFFGEEKALEELFRFLVYHFVVKMLHFLSGEKDDVSYYVKRNNISPFTEN